MGRVVGGRFSEGYEVLGDVCDGNAIRVRGQVFVALSCFAKGLIGHAEDQTAAGVPRDNIGVDGEGELGVGGVVSNASEAFFVSVRRLATNDGRDVRQR